METIQIYKGNFIYSVSSRKLSSYEDSYLIVKDGKTEEICGALPQKYLKYPVTDLGNKIVIPGFCDMHTHAPQFDQRGLGMDKNLIDWLKDYTYLNESKFSDPEYAGEVYGRFAEQLIRFGTLHSCLYATVHKESTEVLFDILNEKGLKAYVGKVNMDINCPPGLKQETGVSLGETEELIRRHHGHAKVRPILTPRFVPSCSSALLEGLGKLASKYDMPVQSHLSENYDEIGWVKKLHPSEPTYSDVYQTYGLFGQTRTLMAHCIHLSDREMILMKNNGVVAVHCPDSNINLSNGIMPVRKMLLAGIPVVLGSDIGGGHHVSMTQVMVSAIQQSKALSMGDPAMPPLTFEEVFYMATRGGECLFGKIGSFEQGYAFDAISIDDSRLGSPNIPLIDRLQRFVYCGDDRHIAARVIDGKRVG